MRTAYASGCLTHNLRYSVSDDLVSILVVESQHRGPADAANMRQPLAQMRLPYAFPGRLRFIRSSSLITYTAFLAGHHRATRRSVWNPLL
jgi:hypothetical protein